MLRILVILMASCFSLISYAATPATFPAQLTISITQAPTPLIAGGKNYLVYEIYLTNFLTAPVTLTSLEVSSNSMGYKPFTFVDADLAKLIHPIGFNKPEAKPLELQPGIAKLVFMWLAFDRLAEIPDKLVHKVELHTYFKDKDQVFTATTEPLVIKKTMPVIIHAPLQGENWFAGNAPSNTSDHRVTGLVVHGVDYFAQRYAIDFIQLGADGKTFTGDEHVNSNYHCYGKDVLAVAKGKVVAVQDGIAENVPRSGKLAIEVGIDNLPGNYVILDIGDGKYACYAHLIPGSIKVKFGDNVKLGQAFAKVGNSGNSSEPHLHFQVVNQASFVGANGVPYAFNRFATRQVAVKDKDFDHIQFLSDKWETVKNELVLENALMKFFD